MVHASSKSNFVTDTFIIIIIILVIIIIIIIIDTVMHRVAFF
jgi:hypothetical protein